MINLFSLLKSQEEGTALVESAITLPILILLISGIFEVTSYALINNKLVRSAGVLGDIVARKNLSRSELISFMESVNVLMAPYNNNQNIQVIVSHICNDGMTDDPQKMFISWQQQLNAGSSRIGVPGNFPTNLPNNIEVVKDQSLIVTEVFFKYSPLVFEGVLNNDLLYKVSIFVPRGESMKVLLGE